MRTDCHQLLGKVSVRSIHNFIYSHLSSTLGLSIRATHDWTPCHVENNTEAICFLDKWAEVCWAGVAADTRWMAFMAYWLHGICRGNRKYSCLQTIRNILLWDWRLASSNPGPMSLPFLTVPSSLSCSSSPSTCTKEPSPPPMGLFLHYSQLHSCFWRPWPEDGRKNNAQITAAGSFLCFDATLRPLWVTHCLWQLKRRVEGISVSPHHTATAQQRQTKLWAQMLQICPNYYYAPSRGRKIPVLKLLTAWMPPWEVLLVNLTPSGWSQAEKLSFVLQAGQAMHCTLPKYLCNQLSLYNLELFSFVMILPKGIALSKKRCHLTNLEGWNNHFFSLPFVTFTVLNLAFQCSINLRFETLQ